MSQSFRVRFPEAEARLPWLASLLDAYAVLDAGIARAVAEGGRQPACRAGCVACCSNAIPASTLELLGLKWFALERLTAPVRRELIRSLRHVRPGRCPFLLGAVCPVYPLRPMACREFVVFGRRCSAGEQPCLTRPHDQLPLPAAAQREAFSLLAPHYAARAVMEGHGAEDRRVVLGDTRLLQEEDWSGFCAALACKISVDRAEGAE